MCSHVTGPRRALVTIMHLRHLGYRAFSIMGLRESDNKHSSSRRRRHETSAPGIVSMLTLCGATIKRALGQSPLCIKKHNILSSLYIKKTPSSFIFLSQCKWSISAMNVRKTQYRQSCFLYTVLIERISA